MNIERLPKVNQIFVSWLKQNLPKVNYGFYSYEGRYIGKINLWNNSIESWIEVPAYHEAFAYVFLFFLGQEEQQAIYDEFNTREKLLLTLFGKAEMDFVEKILEETIPNYEERKNQHCSNFSMMQNLAEDFFQYTNFQTTLFLEELKARGESEFERHLANSKIIELFNNINTGAFRENSFNYVWDFDDAPSGYFRFGHDDRHPLKIIEDKKQSLRRLMEESTKIDLDKLEQDLNDLEQY